MGWAYRCNRVLISTEYEECVRQTYKVAPQRARPSNSGCVPGVSLNNQLKAAYTHMIGLNTGVDNIDVHATPGAIIIDVRVR